MDRVAALAADAGVRPTRRVLLVSGEFPPRVGGVGDHVVRLAAALTACGVDCHVATESRTSSDPANNVHAISSQYPLRALWGTLRLARRIRPDVVHVHYQAGAYARPGELISMGRALQLTGIPGRLVVTFHDLLPPYLFPKAGRLRARMVRGLAESAHAAICVDESDRRQAAAQVGHGARAFWIPAGPTIEPPAGIGDRSAARAALGLDHEDFIVGFFGFRQRSKGVGVLAEAMRRPELTGPGTLLALIGAPEPPTSVRRAEPAMATGTFEGIRLVDTGEQPPEVISRWLIACDSIALPFLDGLSARRGSFMNAVAHGVPVITTLPPDAGTVDVKDGEVGFVMRGDAGALAKALAEIRDNPPRRRQLTEGAQAIAARHTWAEIARRTLDAYDLSD